MATEIWKDGCESRVYDTPHILSVVLLASLHLLFIISAPHLQHLYHVTFKCERLGLWARIKRKNEKKSGFLEK